MKAVKINMSNAKNSKSVKSVVAGVTVNALVTVIGTLIFTMFLSIAGNLFENAMGYIILVPLILGGFLGGFTSAKINGTKGLVMGTVSGFVFFIIMLVIGFAVYNTEISYMILLKALCIILPGAAGGIKGVNKKEKFRI